MNPKSDSLNPFQGRRFARAVAFQILFEREVNKESNDELDEDLIREEFSQLGPIEDVPSPPSAKETLKERFLSDKDPASSPEEKVPHPKNEWEPVTNEEDSLLSESEKNAPPLSHDRIRELMTFTTDLIEAVLTHKEEIDQKITSASDHWRLNRIAVTDRNILRLAIAEIIVMKTPVAVAINEAIELGKQFGSEDSASFINGILGRVVRDGV